MGMFEGLLLVLICILFPLVAFPVNPDPFEVAVQDIESAVNETENSILTHQEQLIHEEKENHEYDYS